MSKSSQFQYRHTLQKLLLVDSFPVFGCEDIKGLPHILKKVTAITTLKLNLQISHTENCD